MKYGTSSDSLKMRNQSPRFGPSQIDINTSASAEKKMGIPVYIYGIAVCFVVGIGIAILQLFFTCTYMFLRCCCWRWLCKKRSDHEKEGFGGYPTAFKKYWPVVFVGLAIALACAFAIVGIVYNNGVSKTFSTTDQENGVGPLVLQAMDALQLKINGMKGDLQAISGTIPKIQIALIDITKRIGGLGTAADGLSNTTGQFGTNYQLYPDSPSNNTARMTGLSSYHIVINGTNWHCDVSCTLLGAVAGVLSDAISTKVSPLFRDFIPTLDKIQDTFTSAADEIKKNLDATSNTLDSAVTQVADQNKRDLVNQYAGEAKKYDGYRNAVFLVLFCVVFITPVLAGLGLSSKKGWPFKCNFCMGPFYLFLIWLLFGVHW